MTPAPRRLTKAALIAAAYCTLTLILAPFSFGGMQLRLSEALCVLPFLWAEAIPGLFAGCLIANLFSSNVVILDMLFGSAATLFAAVCTRACRHVKGGKYLAPLPPVVFNAVLVGSVVAISASAGSLRSFFTVYGTSALMIGISETFSCYALGLPLLIVLQKRIVAKKSMPKGSQHHGKNF